MTGSPAEASAVAALVDQVRSHRCFNLGGRTTLRQLLVIYGLAEVLVTNDSGPAHFASLTGIDVVTLFGPEHPKLFAARTARNHVFWEGITCSPCLSALNNRTSRCRDNLCMQRIDVDRVFDRVCALYETRKHNARRFSGV
jgi:ADP-heptose:LPS heptosyltransferase